MKLEWVFIIVFAVMAGVFLFEIRQAIRHDKETIILVSKALKERDEKLLSLHNRVQALEKERNVYRRVRDLEKQLRAFCVEGKIEMCGKLTVIEER